MELLILKVEMKFSFSSRKHRVLSAIFTALILVLVYVGQQNGWLQDGQKATETVQPGLYSINHFIDGDTIAVNMDGHTETVRFIGVDTPETHKPNTPVQCYGPAAAAYTKNTIGSQKVRLSADPKNTDRDRYGRLLRYVYLPNGKLLNEQLILNGYGFYYPYFPFSKKAQFAADEKLAQSENKGLWSNCNPTPTDDGGYKMDEPAKS
jgi:endonuclease YncB( thermonuclease family)